MNIICFPWPRVEPKIGDLFRNARGYETNSGNLWNHHIAHYNIYTSEFFLFNVGLCVSIPDRKYQSSFHLKFFFY